MQIRSERSARRNHSVYRSQWKKNELSITDEGEQQAICVKESKKGSGVRFSENMLKSFMYIKNYKRIILILAFFLLYISLILIHNAYGTLCIIKSTNSSNINEGDNEVSKLNKANSSNLFVSNVHSDHFNCCCFFSLSTIVECGSVCRDFWCFKIRRNHVSSHDYFKMVAWFHYMFM